MSITDTKWKNFSKKVKRLTEAELDNKILKLKNLQLERRANGFIGLEDSFKKTENNINSLYFFKGFREDRMKFMKYGIHYFHMD